METASFAEKLAYYWDQLQRFFARAKEAPRMIWEGIASDWQARLFLILVLIGAGAGLLYLLVSFLKANWKTKLWMLMILVIVALVLALLFWLIIFNKENPAVFCSVF